MREDKKWMEDIKTRYINTNNLEKIGDLPENWIGTVKGTKKKEKFEQEKDQWPSVETLSVI